MPFALVLGAGMVGSVMALDLATDPGGKGGWSVTIADRSADALASAVARVAKAAPGATIRTVQADLADPAAITRLAREADVVLGALSSRLGLGAMRAVIEAKKPYADIAFMAEDPTETALGLDALARASGVTVVYDFGVAPGMSHVLAAHGAASLRRCESIEIYVGGLPRERRWPFEYKAAFAPGDVIEEYTRPTRLVERHEVVTRPALSEPELLDFAGVGTLEAFNTDGLRSLAVTHLGRVPNMKEKTLRYPGHIALMRAMRETGLFDEQAIVLPGGQRVVPREVTAALMFPKWTYGPGEEDLTVMRVIATGEGAAGPARLQWDLLDFFDRATGCTSMSRTTALPCTIVARMLASGAFARPGVNAPERIAEGPEGAERVGRIVQELARRGVVYRASSV
jgi:saccharopine dehydrogenase-like NADP-dependent oxidoreductase